MNTISSLGGNGKYSGNSVMNSRSESNGSSGENSDFVTVLQQEDHSENENAVRKNVNSNDSEEKAHKERSGKDNLEPDDFSGNYAIMDETYAAVESVIPENIGDAENAENMEESSYAKYLFADYDASETKVSTSLEYASSPSAEVVEETASSTTVAEEALTAELFESSEKNAGQTVAEAANSVKDAVAQEKTTETVKAAVDNVVQTAKSSGGGKVPVSDNIVVSQENTKSPETVAEVVSQSISDSAGETITVKSELTVAGNENNLRQASGFDKADSAGMNSAKLETDDVKILDVKYNQGANNGKQESMSDNTASQQNQDSEGLLKTLTGKMNNFMQRLQNRQQGNNTVSSESSVFSSSRSNASMFKSVATSSESEVLKNAVDTDALNSDSDNVMKALSGLNVDSPRTGLVEANGISTGNNVSTAANQASASTERVEAVQQIVETVQQFAPVQNMGRENSMTMNVEVGSLGKMQIFLEQKENSLKVVIESDTEQGRQEMMNQKDELAQQLRMMGYKELSVEVGSQNQQQNSSGQQEKNSASGNENDENVKLAGNDELDLAEILSMS